MFSLWRACLTCGARSSASLSHRALFEPSGVFTFRRMSQMGQRLRSCGNTLWRTRQGARQRHPRPGEEQNPLSCKYGPLSAVRAEGYTQFLGSIRPANRVERTRTNMSVGHAMKPMSEAHFAILRRHMVEVIGIQVDLASEELGKAALDERVLAAMRNVPRHRLPLRALLSGPSRLPGHAAADRLR